MRKFFITKYALVCILSVVLFCGACAQSGADEEITITTKTNPVITTNSASDDLGSETSDAPDRDEVNLDGGGFQCDWHETVELTEEDALPAEEIPVAFAEDENFWYDIYEDHVAIAQYIGTETVVEVPAAYAGLPVTEIYGGSETSWRSGSGFNETEVEKVVLPEGMLTIHDYAFSWCASLEELVIPDSVTWIGIQAFDGTPWYENLTDEFVIVGDQLLIKYNGNETSVVIPDGVKGIFGAFREDEDLVSVTIPDSVTMIGGRAFEFCSALESVMIPESVVEIGDSFNLCESLVKVDIPESVTVLKDAFQSCYALTEVTGAESVTVLGGFLCCEELEQFPFSDVLIEITDCAFYGSGLTEVDLPQSLKYIGERAFASCGSLESVKNGQNVVKVGENAFKETPWFSSCTDYFVTVGKNVLIGYNGEDTEVIVPDTITYLGGAFSMYSSCYADDPLLSVVIPASVRGIAGNAFTNHVNLSNIVISGEKVEFGEGAFRGLSLESFVIPEGTTVITYQMFRGSNPKEVEIPDSVVIIGNYAFEFQTSSSSASADGNGTTDESLKQVVIPDSVLMIGDGAFWGCKDLTDITIPASVTRIGKDVFEGCSENLTIHGESGSRAESYAAEYGIRFEVI